MRNHLPWSMDKQEISLGMVNAFGGDMVAETNLNGHLITFIAPRFHLVVRYEIYIIW